MLEVRGLERIEKMAAATKAIKELNKNHYDRVVAEYVKNGVDKEIAKVMAKAMIEAKLA